MLLLFDRQYRHHHRFRRHYNQCYHPDHRPRHHRRCHCRYHHRHYRDIIVVIITVIVIIIDTIVIIIVIVVITDLLYHKSDIVFIVTIATLVFMSKHIDRYFAIVFLFIVVIFFRLVSTHLVDRCHRFHCRQNHHFPVCFKFSTHEYRRRCHHHCPSS